MSNKKVMQKWDEYKDKYTLVKCMDGSYYRIWKDKNDLKGIQPLSESCKIDDDAEIVMLSDFLGEKYQESLRDYLSRDGRKVVLDGHKQYHINMIKHKTRDGHEDMLKRLFEMDVD